MDKKTLGVHPHINYSRPEKLWCLCQHVKVTNSLGDPVSQITTVPATSFLMF